MPDSIARHCYVVAGIILLADQLSKRIATEMLVYAEPLPVFSWFDLTLHFNRGAAFSFLSGAGGWQRWLFTGLALLVSVVLVFWLRPLQRSQWLLAGGLALILGGALGNLVDRIVLGHVVDFISVHYRDWYFPTFNIADSAISVGAALVLADSVLGKRSGIGDEEVE